MTKSCTQIESEYNRITNKPVFSLIKLHLCTAVKNAVRGQYGSVSVIAK